MDARDAAGKLMEKGFTKSDIEEFSEQDLEKISVAGSIAGMKILGEKGLKLFRAGMKRGVKSGLRRIRRTKFGGSKYGEKIFGIGGKLPGRTKLGAAAVGGFAVGRSRKPKRMTY